MTIAFWPDNLWPPGYWAASHWNALQPATTLALTTEGAFPCRNAAAGQSLRLTLLPGRTGRFLEHATTTPRTDFHLRLMIGLGDATGSVVLCQGLDAAYSEAWRLDYDAASRAVRLVLRDGMVLSDTLAAELAWHCVEFGIGQAGGSVTLWTNGVPRGGASLPMQSLATQRFRLGVLEKSADASGHMLVDAWQIAEQYIGPPLPIPMADHAGDPARWLVVYNAAWPDAAAWAEQYRQTRGIPYGNLLGLTLSTDESVDAPAWEAMRLVLLEHLDANDGEGRILGILLGCGVPGYVLLDDDVLLPLASLVSTMQLGDGVANPLAAGSRPTGENLHGAYLTARLDAADAAAVITWTQAAAEVTRTDWRSGAPPIFWLAAHTVADEETSPLIDAWTVWGKSTDAGCTRMRLRVSEESDPQPGHWPPSLNEDGIFWGWAGPTPTSGLLGEAAGPRGFALPVHLAAATGPTLRDVGGVDWFSALRAGGYLAVGATSGPMASDHVPDLSRFAAALVENWTIGEAWFAALPRLDAPLFLAGDPLMRLDLPRAGWDVFDPVAQLEHMTPDAPLRRLSADAGELELAPEHWPVGGEVAHYIVRRIDARGHHEAGAISLRLAADGQNLAPCLWPPLWPVGADWPVAVDEGVVRLHLLSDGPLGAAGIHRVELLAMVEGGEPGVMAQWQSSRDSVIVWTVPRPSQPTRYRWRLAAGDGREHNSTWSRWLVPRADAQNQLQWMEVSP